MRRLVVHCASMGLALLAATGVFPQTVEQNWRDLFHLYKLDHEARVKYCVEKSFTQYTHKDPKCVLFHMEAILSSNAFYQRLSFCSDSRDLYYMTERPEHWEKLKMELIDVHGFDAPVDETGKEQRCVRDSSTVVFFSKPGEGHLVNHFVQIKRLFEDDRPACEPVWDATGYHALIIAAEKYEADGKGIDNLKWPVSEAKALKKVLEERYGFSVEVLENPTHKRMVQAFELLRGLTCDEQVIVFFAGHGVFDPATQKGYWLPSDADSRDHSDHFSSTDITDQLFALSAGHVLVISDACYGGAIFNENHGFKEYGAQPADADLRVLAAKPSRQVMTSGKIQRVPDQSLFFRYLLRKLETNTRKFLDVSELYGTVLQDIKDDRLAQPDRDIPTPQFGSLKRTNHKSGSMILRLKDK